MKVMLATPSYSGYVHFNHAQSVAETLAASTVTGSGRHGVQWVRAGGLGCPVLPRVRNILCAQMLADQPDGVPFDGILFVDDDISFHPESARRIVSHGEQIVAGTAQKRVARHGDPPELNAAIERMAPMDKRGLICNTLVPACFLYIHRSVFETLLANKELHDNGMVRRFMYATLPDEAVKWCATYFGYGLASARFNGPERRQADRLGIEDPLVDIGEDYDFAIKCEVAGVSAYIDSQVDLVHYDGRVAHDWSLRRAFETGMATMKDPATLQAAE
jgi:hypothetical protein